MSLVLSGNGAISSSNAVNVTSKLQVTNATYTNMYPAGHPMSIPGLMTWFDFDHSATYANSSDTAQAYSVRDLSPYGKAWSAKYGNNSGYRNTQFQTGPGTSKRVMKTGGSSVSDGGIIHTNHFRYDMTFYQQAHTWVFWVWHGSTRYNNETLVSQNQPVNGSYQIIRAYPTRWEFYCVGTTAASITSTNTGGFNNNSWSMLSFTSYNGDTMRVGLHNASQATGGYDVGSFTQNWNWMGTSGSYGMQIGSSEWGSNYEAWGGGSDTGSVAGYIGPIMLYNNALSTTELTSLFTYYRSAFNV